MFQGTLAGVCEYVKGCPQGARGGGRKKNEVVQVGPVEVVQDEVATSKLLFFIVVMALGEQKRRKTKPNFSFQTQHVF